MHSKHSHSLFPSSQAFKPVPKPKPSSHAASILRKEGSLNPKTPTLKLPLPLPTDYKDIP